MANNTYKSTWYSFFLSQERGRNKEFYNQIRKMTKQLHWWKARDLSIIGRVLIIKTLGLSKFIFASTVLHMPEEIKRKVNEILYQFLWNCKCEKVKRNIVKQSYEEVV